MSKGPTIKTRIKIILKRLFYYLPIQRNKVIFLNFYGSGFGDNLKYIAEEILRQDLSWKLIWLVRNNAYVPSGIKPVNMDGLAAYYELSTAKFIISNCKNNLPFDFVPRKKRKQYYLQTWHGDFALKYIEKEIEDTFSPGYVAVSKADSVITNAVLSGNTSFSTILKDSFWLPDQCEILEFGVPRNDLYFRGDDYRKRLKLKYGFSSEDRFLLYAPTFRDDLDISCYDLDFESIREALSQSSDDSWKIIVRLHPNIASKVNLHCFNDYIIDGSSYSDQQELCMLSDCLITDYSSIMGDFLLMKKPVYLYVPDLEKYSNKSAGRGLRDMFYHLPFSFSHDQQELESHIKEFNDSEYVERVCSFMRKYYNTFDDGHASERVVEHLKSIR